MLLSRAEMELGLLRMSLLTEGSKLLETLKDQNEIRILVDRGNGMGHQSASIQLARRLLARAVITFPNNVQITFVYPTNSEKEKIEKLAPGGKIGGVKYRMLSVGEVANEGWIDYGFTGGSDRPNVEDLTNVVKARYFIKLQPYRWHHDEVIQCNDSNFYSTTTDVIGSHPELDGLEYENSWYASDPIPTPVWLDLAGNLGGLEKVIDSVKASAIGQGDPPPKHRIWLWPVYGLGTKNPFGDNTRRILLNLARGANAARSAEGWRGSFLIVDLSQDRKLDVWSHVKDDLTGEMPNVDVQLLESVQNFVTGVQLKRWDRSIIAIAHVGGGKPSDLMRYLYAMSDLPPVFEGQGTASEVVPMGRPFLKPSMRYMARIEMKMAPKPSDYDYMLIQGFAAAAKQWQEMANELLERSMDAAKLAAFIEEALDPKSTSNRYFHAMGTACADLTKDRLSLAMGLLAKLKASRDQRSRGRLSLVR